MARQTLISLVLGGASVLAAPAWAVTNVFVPDASQLSYSTEPSGKVWIRNLNTFNSGVLGCCWNYSIDPTTPEGKNIWVVLLVAMSQAQSINLGVPDGQAPGAITFVWR
jgi:hypothetical protein